MTERPGDDSQPTIQDNTSAFFKTDDIGAIADKHGPDRRGSDYVFHEGCKEGTTTQFPDVSNVFMLPPRK